MDFPVKTVNVEGPTLLSLYLSTRRENTLRSLERLLGENWHLEYLSTRYGLLPIKEARSVSGRELARSFESVDVLGFSFSPQHFPIAIIALSFVVLLAILATLESARRCSIKFSDVLTDSTLQVVTERRLGRSFLWVFVPGISVWAALPSALLPAQELLTLVFGIVILVILGLACLGRSIDLF